MSESLVGLMVRATRQNAGRLAAACAAPGFPPGCTNLPAATSVAELTVVWESFSEAASCSHLAPDIDCACATAGAENRATHAKTRAVLMAILLTGDYRCRLGLNSSTNGECQMRKIALVLVAGALA